ncbi:TolC family outer membrane protein [Jejubacter calystegiae]|uniref:TolC family outer membrane protein n=2 Tax=Jejubacter calystegiae TaxID=2579935 RepID=A0A4P8YF07_9ENTR|nr:TolC family outer membrane protein [Jejubacter calystegiae]
MGRFIVTRMVVLVLVISLPGFAAPLPQWASGPGVARVSSVTLKESILFAFDRDPSVGEQAAQLGIGQAQIDEARSAWFPQVSLSGSAGHSESTDSSGSLNSSAVWGLTLTQLIYDFGKTNNAIDQRKNQRESYRYQLMSTLTSVAEETALAYAEVKRYDELNAAAEQHINALQDVLRMVSLRADAGLSSRSDALLAETRIAGMRSTQQQYRAALRSARARLGVLTGMEASQYSAMPTALAHDQTPLDNIQYSRIPSVLAAESLEVSSRYGISRAKSDRWPTVSLKGGRTRYQTDNRNYWDDQVQISVDAPLYQGGAVSARVRQAQGERQKALSKVNQAKFDVLQKASVALAEWQGAQGREQAGRQQLENALRTRQLYKSEYKLSHRSLSDLLSVEQDIWQASSSRITADYDGWAAAINYAAALDTLLPLAGIQKNTANQLPDLG